MQNNKRLKRLCLPLLALVGLMAINASAAQATWTLLENEEATDHLNLEVEVLLGELLVPDLNITIHCTGGSGSALLQANEGLTAVIGTASVNFTGCKVLNNKFCTVVFHTLSGEAELAAESEEVFAVMSSYEFANMLLTGAFCTLPKENRLNGSLVLTILAQILQQAPGDNPERGSRG